MYGWNYYMYMYMHIHVRDAYTTETWLPIIHAGHKLCSSSPQVSLQIYYRYLQEPIMKEGRGGGGEGAWSEISNLTHAACVATNSQTARYVCSQERVSQCIVSGGICHSKSTFQTWHRMKKPVVIGMGIISPRFRIHLYGYQIYINFVPCFVSRWHKWWTFASNVLLNWNDYSFVNFYNTNYPHFHCLWPWTSILQCTVVT